MSDLSAELSRSSGAANGEPRLRWASAAAVAALGSWILFDALPGINWVLWTGAAVAGLLMFSRPRGRHPRSVLLIGGAAIVIAGAAAVTASEERSALIALAVVFFLAMLMLLTGKPSFRSITALFAATAPLVAIRIAAIEAMRSGVAATQLIRSTRARAWVRGLAITLPVLVVFALLLAGADPVFAGWRDAVGDLIGEFVPRLVFFVALLVIVLGAYGYASIESGTSPAIDDQSPHRWLGSTERLILLNGIAALFWLFLAVQLGYLFGNLPQNAASGMTFAEYARRGFGELTVVASASALLIVVSERFGDDGGRGRTLSALTFAVIAAVMLLLGSAFRRVLLYEAAYGFTTARLYAQVYMGGVAVGLIMLSLELATDFNAGRLFRRAAAAGTILFIGLLYWNHEGWIASRNMDRFATTGKLDVAYLTAGLTADAIPAIGERLPSLPEPIRSEILRALRKRDAGGDKGRPRTWYEWNLASGRARRALDASAASP
ncbi:MAG: DUF4153 domain-containing protein [Gemmatimonadales bacterium]